MDSEWDKKRLQFLWRAGQSYASTCPQLAASLMARERFFASSKKVTPTSGHAHLCPCCCHVLTCENSRTRVVGFKVLRSKRRRAHTKCKDIQWAHKPTKMKHRKYVVTHCKVCEKTFIMSGVSKPQKKQHQMPTVFQTPQTTLTTSTRKSTGSRRRSSSSTLKRLLRQQQLQGSHTQTGSPKLRDFLTALQH